MLEARPENRFERRPWRTGLGLLVLALALLEAGLRLADPVPLRFAREMRRLHRYSRTSRVDLAAGESVRLRLDRSDGSPLLNFFVTTGEDAFRVADRPGDDDLPPPGAPGIRYVHAVGDSYTMGWGVDGSSSWPAQLAWLLPPELRVVNLGVDGFGTKGATAKSMALASRYPPAHAVYLFVPNDFEDDERATAVAGRPALVHLANEALDAVRRHTAIAAVPFAIRYRTQFRVGPARPAAGGFDAAAADPGRLMVAAPPEAVLPRPDPGRPSFVALLAYRRFLEARAADLTVLVLSTQPESLEALRFCREQGIPAVVVEAPPDMRLADEGHFNARGNRALAALVARLLASGPQRQST